MTAPETTDQSIVLETPRLTLRRMSLDDLDFVASLLDDPEVMRYYPKRYDRQEAQAWVERQIERYALYGHGLWLAIERSTGQPVGQIGLAIQVVDDVEEPEIGYMVAREHWRRGIASEAAAATRDYAFGTLGKPYVISLIRPVNLPSQGVARKIGMTPSRETVYKGLEHIVFSLTAPGVAKMQ